MHNNAIDTIENAGPVPATLVDEAPVAGNKLVPGSLRHCHAVRYRLHGYCATARLRQNFARLMTCLGLQQDGANSYGTELWIDRVPAEVDDVIALRRRNAEMKRPVAISPGWRAIVLEYYGGAADLIIVAHRAVLDSISLQMMADAIISGGQLRWAGLLQFAGRSSELKSCASYLAGSSTDHRSELDWCMGDSRNERHGGNVQIDMGSDVELDSAVLAVAAGVMAARYGNTQQAVMMMLGIQASREPETFGAFEDLTTIRVRCESEVRANHEIDSIRKTLAAPIPQRFPGATGQEYQYQDGNSAAMGVFIAAPREDVDRAARPDEYLPFQTSPCPLTMILLQDPQGHTSLQCSYSDASFDARILKQFTTSVAESYLGLLKKSDVAFSEMDALSPDQRMRVAAMGRSRVSPPIVRARIERSFEEVAREFPSAPALAFGEENLSYRELDEYANRIGRVLCDIGVRNGDRVGVCLERSLELVVVLLGVIKAGATYVPMDPAYPVERLDYMTGDAALRAVVTSKRDFPAGSSTNLLFMERVVELAKTKTSEPLESAASADDAAYIIYTSGSTGRPKGVAIPHHNVLSLVNATRDDFNLTVNDIWTLFHSSAFDFSVWEIWGCLLTGGRLVVVPYWVSRSPAEFLDLLRKEHVTVLNQTPSAFAQLIEAERTHPEDLALRLVIFGGEPLNTRMLVPWFDRHPESECQLINMFGITETTVHVTAETITRNHALKSSRSVGRPLPGWYLYVMDASGRLLPPGIAGEICVGGAGTALYYVNRPDLTAEKFIPDPFGYGRIYRSGDRGRLLPDGRLEHLGRIDSQVKIRGFRIELSEIQSVLLEAPGVTAAAVVLHQEDPNDPASARLNAYLVMQHGRTDEVRKHISRVLPDYMMPASISVLPALPLTGNGKLDVKQLPAPKQAELAAITMQPVATEPADGLAGKLLEVWRGILKVPLGIDDNFFDLGGNSLYAVRIAAVMREQGLPAVPLRDLYVHQTIRRIASSMHVRIQQVPA